MHLCSDSPIPTLVLMSLQPDPARRIPMPCMPPFQLNGCAHLSFIRPDVLRPGPGLPGPVEFFEPWRYSLDSILFLSRACRCCRRRLWSCHLYDIRVYCVLCWNKFSEACCFPRTGEALTRKHGNSCSSRLNERYWNDEVGWRYCCCCCSWWLDNQHSNIVFQDPNISLDQWRKQG